MDINCSIHGMIINTQEKANTFENIKKKVLTYFHLWNQNTLINF